MIINNKDMKKLLNSLFLLTALTLTTSVFTGCKDEPDKYEVSDGNPTISYIRPLGTESADSLLTGAYMDNGICIVGNNLRSIVKMYFNDQEAKLIPSLITDNTMIVTVPGNIPNVVYNKIFMHNKDGEITEYDFKVLVPAPSINNMSNEWAKAGEQATIYGNYFVDDPNTPLTLSIGGTNIPIDEFDISHITFTVPAGLSEGAIEISSVYGKKKAKFNYHDTRGMLFDNWDNGWPGDYEQGVFKHGWHSTKICNDEYSLDGNYILLGDCDVEDGTWDDSHLSFEYWPEATDRLSDKVSFANFANMALKFEVNVPASNPWTNLSMQCIFTGDAQVTNATANNTFFHDVDYPRGLWTPWSQTGSYDTGGEWTTITLPLNTFKYLEGGATAGTPLTADNFTGLTLFIWNGVKSGTTCHPIIRIDNIRVVEY